MHNNIPLISIVMATCNGGKYIALADKYDIGLPSKFEILMNAIGSALLKSPKTGSIKR